MCPPPLRTIFTIMSRCHPLPVKPLFQSFMTVYTCTGPWNLPCSPHLHCKNWHLHVTLTLFFRILPGNGKNSDWHEACHFPVSISRTVLSCVLHMAVRCADTWSLGSCDGDNHWTTLSIIIAAWHRAAFGAGGPPGVHSNWDVLLVCDCHLVLAISVHLFAP